METFELKLVKRLYSRVNPTSMYGNALKLVIDSNNPDEHIQIILEFYREFTSRPEYKLCVNWGEELILDTIKFVEFNPIASQKLIAEKEICFN